MNAEVSRGEQDLRGGQGWIGEGLGTQVGLKRFEGLEVQFREALKSSHASLSLLNIPTIPVFFAVFPKGPINMQMSDKNSKCYYCPLSH